MANTPRTTIKTVKVINIELSPDEAAATGPLCEVLAAVNTMGFTKIAGSKSTGHGMHVLLGRITKAVKDASTVH